MRKWMFALVILAVGARVQAQGYVPSREDIMAFFTTKTLVVLEDNPLLEYNSIIQKVMQQEWNITEYGFISNKEFEEKRMDAQYSFIYMSQVTFEGDKTDATYRFLHLSLGGDYFRLNEMPDLASVPLAYFSVEEERYAYKLAVLVRFIQNHAKLLRERPEIISANVLKHYNDNIKDIKGKTLYLLKEELAPSVNSAARISKVYPYAFKLVTMEEIEEAIKNRDPDVVFLHKVGPEGTKLDARCYNIIIGAADANFYYFDYHKVSEKSPDGFLESDFKNLSKSDR
ncbi:MAG: hypothetical protein JW830_00455 [Bacteroidales bacterium]|nr:hypothetical protein [Bacteroidales bacterium]